MPNPGLTIALSVSMLHHPSCTAKGAILRMASRVCSADERRIAEIIERECLGVIPRLSSVRTPTSEPEYEIQSWAQHSDVPTCATLIPPYFFAPCCRNRSAISNWSALMARLNAVTVLPPGAGASRSIAAPAPSKSSAAVFRPSIVACISGVKR